MPSQLLRRIGLAVLLTAAAVSAVLVTVNQPAVAQPAAPNVPRTYPGAAPCHTSLQACIDGSSNGDVINIQAGVYITSVTLNKAVSLIGAGAASTIIQALPSQRVITVTATMTDSTQIAHLTIQGGNAGAASGGGIFLSAGAQPLLRHLHVVANFAQSGGGIYASSSITLINSDLTNNAATNGNGGGLYAAGSVLAVDSVIQNNTVITNGYGGGVLTTANFTGTNVSFIDNTVNNGYDGGGLYASGALKLAGGQFINNRTTKPKGYGGGGGAMAFGRSDISGTLFSGNSSSDWGGGAYLAYFANAVPSVLTNVQFISNVANSGGGGGLFMWFDSTLNNVDFISNTASYRGGGLYAGYAGSYTETILGGRFVSNTASGGGGLYTDGSFTLDGSQFFSNTSRSGNGGGAWAPANANVSNAYFAYNAVITAGNSGGLDTGTHVAITNTTFLNNRALNGSGGGSGAGGNATLNSVTYIGNYAGNLGGGLITYGGAQVTGSRFENNRASANWGGGVFANTAAWLTDTDFISNTSAYAGGGLASYGQITITGGRFERNLAITNGWGGGLYTGGPLLTISGTQFLSNTATATGGGIVGNATLLTNTTFINNSAATWGGGAEAFGSIGVFSSLFQNNQSQANGGGISSGNTVLVVNSQFLNNTTQGDGQYGGGAIAATLSIAATDSQFTGNTANTSPGGAVASGGGLSISNTSFTENSAANGNGGAAYTLGPASISGSTFHDNGSGGDGGALFISNTLTLSQSLLVNNVAHEGGGLYLAAGSGQIVNTLFARNVSLDSAGMAMHLLPTGTLQISFVTVGAPTLANADAIRVDSGNVSIRNTIVTNHAIGLNRLGGTLSEDYNLFFGNTLNKFGTSGGAHDVNGDPKFVDAANDNYHLGASSAAINVGTDVGVTTDIDGQMRPFGSGFDIGYDEAVIFLVHLPLVIR
jgi:predicted outer membrane repeat protein